MLAGGRGRVQSLLYCGQRGRPIAMPDKTLGQERQAVWQKDGASKAPPFRCALANANDCFVDGTLFEQCHAAQHARFEME